MTLHTIPGHPAPWWGSPYTRDGRKSELHRAFEREGLAVAEAIAVERAEAQCAANNPNRDCECEPLNTYWNYCTVHSHINPQGDQVNHMVCKHGLAGTCQDGSG